MMGKHEVHAAAVYVEALAEIFLAHGRALEVPAGEAFTPGRGPVHDVFGRCFFPQREVGGIVFLLLSVKGAGGREQFVDISARELAVTVVAVVFGHIEVDRAVRYVGISALEYLLDIFYLLDDMARGMRLDRGGQHVESLHGFVIAGAVVLYHVHRFELLKARFLGNLVFALVGIVLEVAYVGDVAHIAHLVAEVAQVAKQYVERDGRTGVAQVAVAIHCRAAHIHAHASLV